MGVGFYFWCTCGDKACHPSIHAKGIASLTRRFWSSRCLRLCAGRFWTSRSRFYDNIWSVVLTPHVQRLFMNVCAGIPYTFSSDKKTAKDGLLVWKNISPLPATVSVKDFIYVVIVIWAKSHVEQFQSLCSDYSGNKVFIGIRQCRKPASEGNGSAESKRINIDVNIRDDDCLFCRMIHDCGTTAPLEMSEEMSFMHAIWGDKVQDPTRESGGVALSIMK